VFISPSSFDVNKVQKADILRLAITNNGVQRTVKLNIFITEGRQMIWTGFTDNFNLAIGTTNFNANNLSIKGETFGNSQGANWLKSNYEFSYGEYEVCYKLEDIQKLEEIDQNCIELRVEPISPHQLIFPEDGSVLDHEVPYFNWTSPMPVNGTTFFYDFKLVEMIGKQSAQDAFYRNPGILVANNLNTTSLNYSLNNFPFQDGKTYAWAVVAGNKKGISFTSEVWQFTYGLPNESKRIVSRNFIIPLEQSVGLMYVNNELKIQLDQNLPDSFWAEILGPKKSVVLPTTDLHLTAAGSKKYILMLNNNPDLQVEVPYMIRIHFLGGDKREIQFQFIQ